MKRIYQLVLIVALICINLYAQSGTVNFDNLTSSDLSVLSPNETSSHTINKYLDSLISQSWIKWKEDFNRCLSPEGNKTHYTKLKKMFIKAIGGLPERTPFHPEITGTIDMGNYKVEKLLFQSMPDFYVTGDLYLPESKKFQPPYPGVLIPCGHYVDSKAHNEYQSMGALCALNGMIALVYDPVDQGERLQFRSDKKGEKTWGTRAHNLDGLRSILLGRNLARFEIWDGMRGIDYLQSRKDVNRNLIGVTGNSGGGTQTAYLMALDDRVKAAAPSCYIQTLNSQTKHNIGDAEQNIFGQLKFGMDHPDYILMNAPLPIKILAATKDFIKIDAVWETFRIAKRYYTAIGYSENLDILENNEGHNYNKTQREGAIRWLARYLQGRDEVIREPKITLLSEKELNASSEGRVLKIKGAKSIFDLQKEELKREDKERKHFLSSNDIETIRKKIRELIDCNSFDQIGSPKVIVKGILKTDICNIQKIILSGDDGIYLPSLLFIPLTGNANGKVLFISEEGKAFNLSEIEAMIKKGNIVLSVDLPGIGETKNNVGDKMNLSKNLDSDECYKAYFLGKSIVGMRSNEIMSCVKYLRMKGTGGLKIELICDGETGVPALHTAFLEPEIFGHVQITNSLVSWHNVMNSEKSFDQQVNTVNGVLKYYDLPDIVKLLGDKVTIDDPQNAMGFDRNSNNKKHVYSNEPKFHGLAGVWYGQVGLHTPEGPALVDSLNLHWSNEVDKRGRDWSAEWYGFINSPFTGKVNFYAATNQMLSLNINGKKIIELNTTGGKAEAAVSMEKGKKYPVKIIFNQDKVDSSFVKISWSWKNHPESIIGNVNLYYSPNQKHKMDTAWR